MFVFYKVYIGGGGGLEYLVQSNDNAESVEPDDRYKFIDDLSVLQLVLLSGLLVEYRCWYRHEIPS